MTCYYSDKIAARYGINSALVAGFMWNEIKENGTECQGKEWIRCSQNTLCVVFPFMGKKAVSNALKRLLKTGILKKSEYNESCFDRTASYAFTEYGEAFMSEEDLCEY